MLRYRVCLMMIAAAAGASPALGGLYDDIFRGLELFTTPSGSPIVLSADGSRTNGARSGRLRVVPELGGGYTLELDRTFGLDSSGRPEILDLGPTQLQLSGAVSGTAGITRRGMLIASGNFNVTNLAYNMSTTTGVQNLDLTGTLDVASNFEVNRLGFYSLNLNVRNNNSQVVLDGVTVRDEQDTEFDVGPIFIEGNLFVDAILAILNGIGLDTSELAGVTPRSPLTQVNGAIAEALGARADSLIGELGLSEATSSRALRFGGEGQPTSTARLSGVVAQPPATRNNLAVPEPSTLLLLAAGSVLILRARRFRV